MAHAPCAIPIPLYPDKNLLGKDTGHNFGFADPVRRVPDVDDYDFSGDCEPSCSCYRTECPELFCSVCNKVQLLTIIKERFPAFKDYCVCGAALIPFPMETAV